MLLSKKSGIKCGKNQMEIAMEFFPYFIPTLKTKIPIFKS